MNNKEYERQKQIFINDLLNGKIINQLGQKISSLIKKDVDAIYKNSIKEYYDDYPNPRRYDRKYSLYSMYHIKARGAKVKIDEGPQYSQFSHRAKEKYIFDMMFSKGWHGGAIYKDGLEDRHGRPHPFPPDGMAWRGPAPYYLYWLDVEVPRFTPSILERVNLETDNYKNNKQNSSGSLLFERQKEALQYVLKKYQITKGIKL